MEKINYNFLEIPDYLNLDFFERSLKSGMNLNTININKISFSAGNTNGNGYTSQIYRAAIDYSIASKETLPNNKIFLIIKIISNNDLLENLKVFEREFKMYFEILPKLEKTFNNQIKFGPKCYYATKEPANIMVFEDLKELGYKLEDRINGFDELHSMAVLAKIAKFHAASMILFKTEPELNDFHTNCLNIDNQTVRDEIFLENIKYLQKYLSNWQNYDSIIMKLENIEKKFYDKCAEVTHRKNIGLTVLNHGDLWVDNIMFKKDENDKIVDVIFFDYQISYYGSLGLDLQNLLNNSIAIDVLKSKRYDFLHYYYSHFRKTLELNIYSDYIPNWNDFKNEIKLTEFFGFISMEAYLPLTIAERINENESPSLEIFNDKDKSNQTREKSFKSKRMIETLKYSLNRFDELGVFD